MTVPAPGARHGRALGLALLALGAIGLGAWLSATRDDSLSRLVERRTIRLGYAVEPPYAFVADDGRVTGESPEVARIAAERLGLTRVEWRQSDFGDLVTDLLQGRIDGIAAGLFITPERAATVRFSLPTLAVRPGLLVAAGNPLGLTSCARAATRDGIRIALLAGAVEQQLMRDLGLTDARRVLVPDALTGVLAVEQGVADALVLSAPTVRWMADHRQIGGTEAVLAPDPAPGYGHVAFAFRPGDRRLADAWDAALSGWLGGRQHLHLLGRFGFSAADIGSAAPNGGAPP